MAPDKIKIKKEMPQLSIKDCWFFNILICAVKIFVPNFFDKEKACASLWKLTTLLKVRTKARKIHCY